MGQSHSNANAKLLIGEASFDVASQRGGRFVYALDERAKSIVLEFSDLGAIEATGTVSAYLQEATGLVWRTIKAGTIRVMPLPGAKSLSFIPSDGATGLFIVTLSGDSLGVGLYTGA